MESALGCSLPPRATPAPRAALRALGLWARAAEPLAAKVEPALRELDRALVLRARAGDRTAFAELYERFASTVHGILLATASWQDAQDLVQDVFASALARIGRLEDPERFPGWLAAIARNRGRDALRRRREHDVLPEDVRDARADGAPPEGAEGAEAGDAGRARAALELVRGLPASYRETLILRLVEGLSGPEIAERTGLTHGSVRVNLHRGMKLLRERLLAKGFS